MFFSAKSFTQTAGILTLLGGAVLSASAQGVVVPAALATAPGPNSNLYPFSPSAIQNIRSMRYQQIYGASDFAAKGPITIRQISFRPSELIGGNAFTGVIPDIQIDLSTTSKALDGLSVNFSDNIGDDDTVVYSRGALPLSSAGADLGGYYAFDVVITLTQPFTYDPSKGNLLLDVRNFAGSFTTPMDAQKDSADTVSRVYAPDVTAVAGTADTLGLVTQFTSQILRTISGVATLEGSANPTQSITFKLQNLDLPIAPPTIVTETLNSTTGSHGLFSLGGIPAGRYSLNVKGAQWLAASQTVDVTARDAHDLTFLLLAGDANNDNMVDATDFGILVGAYGGDTTIDGSGYDPQADFNNDGSIDTTDFGLLVGNYNSIGAN